MQPPNNNTTQTHWYTLSLQILFFSHETRKFPLRMSVLFHIQSSTLRVLPAPKYPIVAHAGRIYLFIELLHPPDKLSPNITTWATLIASARNKDWKGLQYHQLISDCSVP